MCKTDKPKSSKKTEVGWGGSRKNSLIPLWNESFKNSAALKHLGFVICQTRRCTHGYTMKQAQYCDCPKEEPHSKCTLQLKIARLAEAEFILRGSRNADKLSQHAKHMPTCRTRKADWKRKGGAHCPQQLQCTQRAGTNTLGHQSMPATGQQPPSLFKRQGTQYRHCSLNCDWLLLAARELLKSHQEWWSHPQTTGNQHYHRMRTERRGCFYG